MIYSQCGRDAKDNDDESYQIGDGFGKGWLNCIDWFREQRQENPDKIMRNGNFT